MQKTCEKSGVSWGIITYEEEIVSKIYLRGRWVRKKISKIRYMHQVGGWSLHAKEPGYIYL